MAMFNIVALTGERMRLTAPNNLPNATYSVDIIVPLVRCDDSDDDARSLTATAAYKEALGSLADSYNKTDDMIFYPQNLTFTSSKMGFTGQIGYYASPTYNIKNDTIDDTSMTIEFQIAMADPPESTDAFFPNPSSASYYKCFLVNASLTTDINFEGNAQTLHARNIKETEYTNHGGDVAGTDDTVLYAEENYDSFASVLFELPTGIVLKWSDYSGSDWNWSTKVDQTILGTSKDFSSVIEHWRDQELEPGATIQDKNLTTLIEELSLNASWSLMGVPAFT
ncbi:hypothetical protein SLS60_001483 [Paraconiothyrium brasiliense]|uniref:Uncharacterized protein n=1 Tax=Paraconiothyrium brasiliense TaxID=300254 RepID=A0ABR3S980_9PLEO